MKVVYMGTPDFAVGCLESLINAGHEICAVFSQPDKPVGRKQILTAPPVKEIALKNNIPVFQPISLKNDDTAYNIIKNENPDVIVVVAYGKLLPKSILDIAKYGCINVHASLLPKLRGASPVQTAIVNGDKVTGVTTMLLDEGMDTGDILLSREIAIENTDTAETMFEKLSVLGAELLIDTLNGLENGTVTPIKQDESLATHAKIIEKEDALIDFNKSANEIDCLIRGLHIWPVAYTYVNDKRMKIYSAEVVENCNEGECGEILSQNKAITVQCGMNTALKITELQLEGSKRMRAVDFLNGKKLDIVKF